MSIEIVKKCFESNNINKEILEFPVSSATVELAAQAVGVEPARIAKTLSFYTKEKDGAILIVTAGDMKIDNSKFKHVFGMKRVPVLQSRAHSSIPGCLHEKIRYLIPGGRKLQFRCRAELR